MLSSTAQLKKRIILQTSQGNGIHQLTNQICELARSICFSWHSGICLHASTRCINHFSCLLASTRSINLFICLHTSPGVSIISVVYILHQEYKSFQWFTCFSQMYQPFHLFTCFNQMYRSFQLLFVCF